MSNASVTKVVDKVTSLFTTVDEALSEWQGEGNLQFPALFAMLATKLGWDEKQLKEADPVIRYYVRNSDDWLVTRGARGGIQRASDKQKKLEAQQAKEQLKKKMKEKIEQASTATTTALAAVAATPESSFEDDSLDESDDDFDREVEDSFDDE